MSSMKIPFAIGLVIFGCCSNVVFLELIINDDPGTGNIITFFQFFVVALVGLFQSRFMQKKRVIPLKEYCYMVLFYFSVSVVNNYAFNFDIPMPLHMIFRSGSLIANMFLGMIILNRRYSLSKYVAVLMITSGIAMATMASANMMEEDNGEKEKDDDSSFNLVTLCIGVSLLTFALFVSAGMGIYQETLYSRYGKHPKEAMFYTHALPLPGFLLLAPSIYSKFISFSASTPVDLGFVSVPVMWIYLIMNGILQYVCISGVFILTTECPSLVVTLVITLRKFLSLLFSIFYFQNPFTFYHWIGTICVFSGTALFSGLITNLLELAGLKSKQKKK